MKKLHEILVGVFAVLAASALYADESPSLISTPLDSRPASVSAAAPEKSSDVTSDAPAETRPDAAIPATSTLAQESLWKRVRNGFSLPEIDSPLVARHEAWFLNHPDYFQRMIERSRL
ncbi:MAG: hypothetical protein ABI728_04825, partial [Betaproteobacteria bacterium]